MTAAKKSKATKPSIKRELRWVQVNNDGQVQWNQIKHVPHPKEDRTVSISTDRTVDFVRTTPNPDYVSPENREAGKKYSADQRRAIDKTYKFPKKTRDALNKAGETALAQLEKLTGDEIVQATFSAEAGQVTYIRQLILDGVPFNETATTADDTIIEVFQELADEVARVASTSSKPVTIADGNSHQLIQHGDVEADVREP